uniref:ABC transmembrane type-1 domain-containing protein n=1 Tax=Oryza meridionalis TaxID=40149 RepID=A0A0E0E2W0_9ORYZ
MAGRSGENGGGAGGDLSEPLLDKEAARRYSELYSAGVLSRLTFSWLNPLLRLGRSKALDLADVPLIASEDGAARASERFADAWSLHGHGKDGGGGGLVGVLLRCFLGEIMLTGFYALVKTLAIAVSPLLLFAFVRYTSHKEEERRDLAAAAALVGSLLAIKLAESLSQRHWFFGSRRTGMRVRSALMAAVFRKQLRLSARARRRHSAGEVVGYVAVDAYRLGDAVSWLHTSWSSPLQLALAVATLLWALRLGALPGLVPLVAFGFLNVELYGTVAYVSQNSWIQSGTVRDNILFGKPFSKERYERAIRACALDKDIENFDHGDLTEIGQRGINMSGGQKQRIQLARAVYSDADVYLLDDPFSAVDAHTAAVLFYDCVMTALSEKTVVLVTHQVEFLTETDRILVMEDGYVKQQGVYTELMESGTAFEKLVSAHKSSITALDDSSQQSQVQEQNVTDENTSGQASDIDSVSAKGQPSATQLTEEEEKEIGDLGWKPYKDYINVSKGITHLCVMGVNQVLFTSFQMMATFWLAVAVQMNVSSALLVGAYSGLSILSCCFAYIRTLYAAKLGLKASKAFFTGLMDSVFKAPMSFFDSTPVGRILTRASSDLSILDFDIPYSVAYVVVGASELVTTILVTGAVTWQVLIVAIPVTITVAYVQRHYVASARDLARINGTTKAPVMNYAAESILGVVTIRAFGETDRFIRNNLLLIDTDATLFFHTVAAQEWVLIRVEALQSLTLLTAALLLVLAPPGAVSPGFAGLSLSFALSLTAVQAFLTKFYSYMENYIISVERIKQYMHLPSEPPAIIPENRPPSSWPQEGQIDLQDLKGQSGLAIHPELYRSSVSAEEITKQSSKPERLGRSGGGRHVLGLAAGQGHHLLLDRLPANEALAEEEENPARALAGALEKCQLQTAIRSTPALLDTVVSDDGSNWSVGQRQLFCLGRVLLRRNKILVLDEATASIDSATDAILQRVIRQQFSSCTVVTIAHRVPTVTDSDKVMVLSYGKLIEYDTPAKLLEDKQTAFAKLVAEYWANSKRNAT